MALAATNLWTCVFSVFGVFSFADQTLAGQEKSTAASVGQTLKTDGAIGLDHIMFQKPNSKQLKAEVLTPAKSVSSLFGAAAQQDPTPKTEGDHVMLQMPTSKELKAQLLKSSTSVSRSQNAAAAQNPRAHTDHIMIQSGKLASHRLKAELLKNSVSGSSLLETDVSPIMRAPIPDAEEDEEKDSVGDLLEAGDVREEGDEGYGEEDEDEEEEDEHEPHEADSDRIQRVAKFADANNDSHISVEEMKDFAFKMKEQQRQQQTNDSLIAVDTDSSGDITMSELRTDLSEPLALHQQARFDAADKNQDGRLQWQEFHHFVHPELDDAVLVVEAAYQLEFFDKNKDGVVDFEEFKAGGIHHDEQEFDEESGLEDFALHDKDLDHVLSAKEFGRMLHGHDILHLNINKLFSDADMNGDNHLHIDDEMPHQMTNLLGSEFIEDFFYHETMDAHHYRHDEF